MLSYQQLGQAQTEKLNSIESKPTALNTVLGPYDFLRLRFVVDFDGGIVLHTNQNSETPGNDATQAAEEQEAAECAE